MQTRIKTPEGRLTPPGLAEILRAGGRAAIAHQHAAYPHTKEAAIGLVIAGSAPLLGHLLLGWQPGSMVASLLLNLSLGIIDRIAGLIRAQGHDEIAVHRHNWSIADLLSGRSKSLPSKSSSDKSPRNETEAAIILGSISILWLILSLPLFLLADGIDLELWEIIWGSVGTLAVYFGRALLRPGMTQVISLDGNMLEIGLGQFVGFLAMFAYLDNNGQLNSNSFFTVAIIIGLSMVGLGAYRWVGNERRATLSRWLENWLRSNSS